MLKRLASVSALVVIMLVLAFTVAEALERSVKSNQRNPREIVIDVTGASGSSGSTINIGNPEVNLTEGVTGLYVFTFVKPFQRTPVAFCNDQGTGFTVAANSESKLGFHATVHNASQALADSTFHCLIKGWDATNEVAP